VSDSKVQRFLFSMKYFKSQVQNLNKEGKHRNYIPKTLPTTADSITAELVKQQFDILIV